jgi:hypothetical protein
MKSARCIHCGLINWADAEACKRCGNSPQQTVHEEFGGWSAEAGPAPYGVAKKRTGLAVASLVVGVVSLVTFSLLIVGAVVGIVLGIVAVTRAGREPEVYGGRGLAVGGIVTSALSLVMILPLMLVAAIAIPNLLAARRAANEASAIHNVRMLIYAEGEYSASTGGGEFGTMEDLAKAGLVEGQLADGLHNGYMFTLVATDDTCAVTAVPMSYGSSGRRSFYATCDGSGVHYTDNGGGPADSSDPLVEEPTYGGKRLGGGSRGSGSPSRPARPRY